MKQQNVMKGLFFLGFYLLTQAVGLAQAPAQATSCHVVGLCHDHYTASGLKATIYGLINQKKVKLTECDKEGVFDAQVPVRATHLIFEREGYKPTSFPVYFVPDLIQDDRFGIWNWGEMVPKDSFPNLPVYLWEKGSLRSVHYHFDDIIDIVEELTEASTGQLAFSDTYFRTKGVRQNDMFVTPTQEGNYVRRIKTTDGSLISEKEITIRRGITFESIRIRKPADKKVAASKNPASGPSKEVSRPVAAPQSSINRGRLPTAVSIYFEQSSYELTAKAKQMLDSVAALLTNQPTIKARLTGYTDNVGDQKLNLTLSEYRAKAVNQYLMGQGVARDRLTVGWKGSDPKALPQATEMQKEQVRRVVIGFEQ